MKRMIKALVMGRHDVPKPPGACTHEGFPQSKKSQLVADGSGHKIETVRCQGCGSPI